MVCARMSATTGTPVEAAKPARSRAQLMRRSTDSAAAAATSTPPQHQRRWHGSMLLAALSLLLLCCLFVPLVCVSADPAVAAAPEPDGVRVPRRQIGVPPPMPVRADKAPKQRPAPEPVSTPSLQPSPVAAPAPSAAAAPASAASPPVDDSGGGGAMENDQTTHISYSADDNTETHCDRTGECVRCSTDERSTSSCHLTGFHQLVTCRVLGPANRTDASSSDALASSAAPILLRSYTQYTSCENDSAGVASFWLFELLCVVGVCSGAWLMKRRRRVVQSLHHRRMDRLVNS